MSRSDLSCTHFRFPAVNRKMMTLCAVYLLSQRPFIVATLGCKEYSTTSEFPHVSSKCPKPQSVLTPISQIKSILYFRSAACHTLCPCAQFLYHIGCFHFQWSNSSPTLVSLGCALEHITAMPSDRARWHKTRFQDTQQSLPLSPVLGFACLYQHSCRTSLCQDK